MAEKRAGNEPSVNAVRARCPVASTNPSTGEPFTDKYILQVFRARCTDEGSDLPWGQYAPNQKTALSPEMIQARWNWARAQLRLEHPPEWYFRHCVWLDPCSTILSVAPRAAFDESQAAYGKGKRWMSADTRVRSRNTRASPYATKQQQFGDRRVWWFIIMTRGKVHFEIMPPEWTQTGEGMATMVDGLEGVLHKMLGRDAALPRILASDRGPGLYQSSTGHIVRKYNDALKANGFRTYAGEDASKQPPDIPDVLPHETAVGWARTYMKKRPLSKADGLEGMEMQLKKLLLACQRHINAEFDVEGLCRSFPRRLGELNTKQGERLKY